MTTLLVLLAAYPVSFLLATCKASTRARLIILVLLPFWTSFVIRCFAWIVILGRQGVLNKLLLSLGLVDAPVAMVFNTTGVLVGMMHAMMPLCVVSMLSVMDGIDMNLMRAAGTLGAPKSQAFWRVYFPLSLAGVSSGGLLVFIVSMGFFITPALLGGAKDQMISQLIIFQVQTTLDWGFAGAIAVLLLLTIVAIFFVYNALFGLSTMPATMGRSVPGEEGARALKRIGNATLGLAASVCESLGRAMEALLPYRADTPRLVSGRVVAWIVGGAILAFLAVPAFFVIPVSFTGAGYLSWPPQGFSLRWYQQIFESSVWWDAAGRSMAIGCATALLATLVGTPAAFALVRGRFRAKGSLMALLLMPMMVPSIITALSLFKFFSFLGMVGTSAALVIGHSILAIPYVVVSMVAVLKGYDSRLDQAAFTLGASRAQTLRLVTLPILKGGLFAAFTFAFAISFDELTVALFLTGGEIKTLPRALWDAALLNVTPELTAVASLLLLIVTLVVLIGATMRRRQG
ncbi:ABC transporter permease subunit [Caballeronia glebae]|uniref:ABC transporter permease subunit n=1 Tax=Caballeronia glebae TaxID=1777143 RepID=UPI0038B97822